MSKKIEQLILEYLFESPADSCAVGVIDFDSQRFETYQYSKQNNTIVSDEQAIYFDLASVTKPFVNSLSYLISEKSFDESDKDVLNHRAGLPAWGLLSSKSWKEQINSYVIKKSETLYSDFSALRFMLNYEKKNQSHIYKLCSRLWDKEVIHWLDLKYEHHTIQNGFVNGLPNYYCVHDPNALNITERLSHAGLFSTLNGVCKTLINADDKYQLLSKMKAEIDKNPTSRFVAGWDRALNLETTLAGSGCSKHTFGHLGFTGTSIWIDSVKKRAHIILTNSTKEHWYDKNTLNHFRKKLGAIVWANC